ncbi:MAG: hypothetical protein PHQ23_07975 [Candidatus Wallbacteria bacterium]|nr:hypothetical protein [Candidatus Wallbacteria bacterium]
MFSIVSVLLVVFFYWRIDTSKKIGRKILVSILLLVGFYVFIYASLKNIGCPPPLSPKKITEHLLESYKRWCVLYYIQKGELPGSNKKLSQLVQSSDGPILKDGWGNPIVIYFPKEMPRKLVLFSYGENGRLDMLGESDDLRTFLILESTEVTYIDGMLKQLFERPDNLKINGDYLTDIPENPSGVE